MSSTSKNGRGGGKASGGRPKTRGKVPPTSVAEPKPLVLQAHVNALARVGGNHPIIGEYSSICLFGPEGQNVQYTICRPIGITDLVAGEWTMIKTDQVLATIARRTDPNAKETEAALEKLRLKHLVGVQLLVHTMQEETDTYHYPSDKVGKTRNMYIREAKDMQKKGIAVLREKQKAFTKETKKEEITEVNTQLSKAGRLLNFIPDVVRANELAIILNAKTDAWKAVVSENSKTAYRTMTGPFANQPQKAMTEMKGLRLIDVVSKLHENIVSKWM